ncbi:MAG: galactokinase [Desulfobacterales bacterium]|jgi:D-glycero-alpha-D-manno-heptose-7-phosphate kinase
MGDIVADYVVKASAPCRVDMGGTLDIGTFYYPLQYADPCTVNVALNMRTRVTLHPYREGWIKVSSRGFDSAAFPLNQAPFDHVLGLMFAVAVHFKAAGVHIKIDSASPPRSALGGSSVAAVALVGALARCRALAGGDDLTRDQIVRHAQRIEETVAGVPCGVQDQLGAAYGGVNLWHWEIAADGLAVRRETLARSITPQTFKDHLLVAYGGIPHESRDINGTWVRRFLAGRDRTQWVRVADWVRRFGAALDRGNWAAAAEAMWEETAIRCAMTPQVLDDMGRELIDAARRRSCGGRFTGAGGGGCLWAVGEAETIKRLRGDWKTILAKRSKATLLDVRPELNGLMVEVRPRHGQDQ